MDTCTATAVRTDLEELEEPREELQGIAEKVEERRQVGLEERAPVFVDETGRRKRVLRFVGWLLGVLCFGYMALIGVGFAAESHSPSFDFPSLSYRVRHSLVPRWPGSAPSPRRATVPAARRHAAAVPRDERGAGPACRHAPGGLRRRPDPSAGPARRLSPRAAAAPPPCPARRRPGPGRRCAGAWSRCRSRPRRGCPARGPRSRRATAAPRRRSPPPRRAGTAASSRRWSTVVTRISPGLQPVAVLGRERSPGPMPSTTPAAPGKPVTCVARPAPLAPLRVEDVGCAARGRPPSANGSKRPRISAG